MKKLLAVLLAVMLLIAAVPATSLAASSGDKQVYHVSTKGGTLYMRRDAGTSAAVVTSLPNGTALVKLSSKTVKNNGVKWINVRALTGGSGWVASSYVKSNAHADINTKTSGLNVRSSRSAKNTKNILYSIPHDTKKVTVYKINGNWAYVNWNGLKKGWASINYLKWTRW